MLYMDCLDFATIDGLDFLEEYEVDLSDDDTSPDIITIPGGYEFCHMCEGDEDYISAEDMVCGQCGGDGHFPDFDLAGWCSFDGCQIATVNKSHGEWLCTEHDESRHIEIINNPSKYDRTLL